MITGLKGYRVKRLMGEKVNGRLMITDSADWTDVSRRTVEGNAKFRELTVN